MDRQQLLQLLSEWLEHLLWQCSPEALRGLQADLPAHLTPQGFSVSTLLGQLSDEALVLAVQKEFLCREAFEELFEKRYKRPLLDWCLRRGLTIDDALNLLHTVFLKFLETRFASYQVQEGNTRNFRAFLWTAARNQNVQDWRKRQRESQADDAEPLSDWPSTEQEAEADELKERVEEALQRRPELDRRIMRLTMQEWTVAEIAREVGLTYAAVSMRLHRTRKFLRRELGLL